MYPCYKSVDYVIRHRHAHRIRDIDTFMGETVYNCVIIEIRTTRGGYLMSPQLPQNRPESRISGTSLILRQGTVTGEWQTLPKQSPSQATYQPVVQFITSVHQLLKDIAEIMTLSKQQI